MADTAKAIHWIIIIGLAVYFISLFNGFVWDDYPFLLNNADIRSINIPHLFSKNVFNDASFYRPLPAVYNAVIYSMAGDMPFLYHVSQLLLHCSNAVLVFLLFKKFLTKSLSFFLALVFLVHPINVEAVAYISAANNELFFLFGMLALLLSTKANLKRVHVVLICLFSLLSLLSRETGLAFLFLIVIYQFIFAKRKTVTLLGVETLSLGLYFFLRFVYAGIYYTKEITRYPIPIAQLSFIERLQNIPLILFYYFSHIVYPANFAVSQHWIVVDKTFDNFYLPLLVTSLLFIFSVALALYLYKRKRDLFKIYIFFALWFLSGIIFIIQIIPLELTVADHWMYFPLIGILGILGVCIKIILAQKISKRVKKIMIVLAILILVLLSIRTTLRITNYKDEITLYTHDSMIYSDWKLENDLGSDYARMGDMKNAYIHFKRSYDYYPTPWNLYHLGMYYQELGDTKNAHLYYSRAYIAMRSNEFKSLIKPGKSNLEYNVYVRLATILFLEEKYAQSLEYSKLGLKGYPNASDLWVTRAASEYFVGNQSEAVTAASKAKELSPNTKTEYLYNQIKNKKPLTIQ